MGILAPLQLAQGVIRFESDARTPAHGRAGCAHSQSFAKQNPLPWTFRTKCLWSAERRRTAFDW